MVRNISNPLNARKVAKILAEDARDQGYNINEREINVYLSDNRIGELETAIIQLKQQEILSPKYSISERGLSLLREHDFIDDSYNNKQDSHTNEAKKPFLDDGQLNSTEFKNQLESLKNKLLKSWSGGLNIEGNELDNFDRKFGRPMKYFKASMEKRGVELSDLQAFTVVFATDHLSLGDNSKEEVYHMIFGRFDEISSELEKQFGFTYQWPDISGTSFIELGKKFTVVSELADFARQFRSISGLDTYSYEVIQFFFVELIRGKLFEEMVAKKIIFRWVEEPTNEDPKKWLIPPTEFDIDRNVKELLYHTVIAHTIFAKIQKKPPTLLDILTQTKGMEGQERVVYLAKKLEATLTRKSIALQFGTTISNCFENFKTNPAKITPFIDSTVTYFYKSESIDTIINTLKHNIRTGMKNSTGILKKYLQEISNEQLTSSIANNISMSIKIAIENLDLPYKSQIVNENNVDMNLLDQDLRTLDTERLRSFFTLVFDQVFILTNRYTRNLAPEKEEPMDKSGGLAELTQDFLSTVSHHASKNTQTKPIISKMIDNGIDEQIAQRTTQICSYITYQVASKEGENGKKMLVDLTDYYTEKIKQLGEIKLTNGSLLKENSYFTDFISHDLQQIHAIVALGSKIKTDAYNAWTPLQKATSKHAVYLNKFILPNMFYWQRIPKELVTTLLNDGLIEKNMIRDIVIKTRRLSLYEAYSLLCMGTREEINSFSEANVFLNRIFGTNEEISFHINPRSGEAEITQETIFLWSKLQEVE